jgi:hypothetical protein
MSSSSATMILVVYAMWERADDDDVDGDAGDVGVSKAVHCVEGFSDDVTVDDDDNNKVDRVVDGDDVVEDGDDGDEDDETTAPVAVFV